MEPNLAGRHAIFRRNIFSITGCRSFPATFKGWEIKRLINNSHPMASCELCGARFRDGALLRHFKTKATITVGHICVSTIREKGFGPPKAYRSRQQKTWKLFQHVYGDRMVRGTWLTWFIANAPPRLASTVFDLKYLGATVSDEDMLKLIKFHDANRRYPATALVDYVRVIIKSELKQIPRYLTLDEARRLMRQACGGGPSIISRRRSEEYCKTLFPRRVWKNFSPQTDLPLGGQMRRIMGALNKLSSREEILKKYASRFRDIPSSGSGFIWNPSIGLGYVSRYGYPDTKARVYLYRDSTWGLFDIQPRYFRSIEPCDKKVVRELEKLAFPAEVRIINERSYNAFAQGTSKTKSRVCFYSALVRDFKEPEIEGILGHELSHLYHNDCRLSVTYNHIVTIFNFLQIIFFSIGMVCFRIGTVPVKRRRKGGGGEAFIQLGFLVSGLFLLLCYLSLYGARITACILQFALSRQAEYRADQSSAALIGKQKMIAALEHLKESPEPKSIFPRLRSSLTVDPVSQMKNTARFMESIFATHPPLGKRIRALEAAGIS